MEVFFGIESVLNEKIFSKSFLFSGITHEIKTTRREQIIGIQIQTIRRKEIKLEQFKEME
jgi:hypothetical protein